MDWPWVTFAIVTAASIMASAIYIRIKKNRPLTIQELETLTDVEPLHVVKLTKISRIDGMFFHKIQGPNMLCHYQAEMKNSSKKPNQDAWIETIEIAIDGRMALCAIFEEGLPVGWKVAREKEFRRKGDDSEKVPLEFILSRMRAVSTQKYHRQP